MGCTNRILPSFTETVESPIRSSIDSGQEIWVRAKTGLPKELEATIPRIEGQPGLPRWSPKGSVRIVILEFKIIDWVVVVLKKAPNSQSFETTIEVRPSYLYDGLLRPSQDLYDEGLIIGAFTSPSWLTKRLGRSTKVLLAKDKMMRSIQSLRLSVVRNHFETGQPACCCR